mmetsp:Transcript_49389/g.105109  ORF Transcript_49389/g.105109 Transcript_49389/m.105109 type:complete len:219 (+) Transcript_49389:219-875(+)
MGQDISLDCCSSGGCGKDSTLKQRGGGRPENPASASMRQEMVCNSKLLKGAKEGDVSLVRKALDFGANTETRQAVALPGNLGTLPEQGKLRRQVMVPVTAKPSEEDFGSSAAGGWTPLMFATHGGHLTCVMALLDARANVEAEDDEGGTALHMAAAAGDLDVFKALVLARGDGLLHDRRGALPLDHLPDRIMRVLPEVRLWESVMNNELPGIPGQAGV